MNKTNPLTLKKNNNLASHNEAVRVRTDKANFGLAPISLSFSLEVNNIIPCTNITFILIKFIYFIFYETILKVTLGKERELCEFHKYPTS